MVIGRGIYAMVNVHNILIEIFIEEDDFTLDEAAA